MIIASTTPDLPRYHINSSPLIRNCGPAKHMTVYEVTGAVLCNRLGSWWIVHTVPDRQICIYIFWYHAPHCLLMGSWDVGCSTSCLVMAYVSISCLPMSHMDVNGSPLALGRQASDDVDPGSWWCSTVAIQSLSLNSSAISSVLAACLIHISSSPATRGSHVGGNRVVAL